ncbi:MAG: hypothetical protein QXD62_01150 [Candidatus Woesearchaeota archaeon]
MDETTEVKKEQDQMSVEEVQKSQPKEVKKSSKKKRKKGTKAVHETSKKAQKPKKKEKSKIIWIILLIVLAIVVIAGLSLIILPKKEKEITKPTTKDELLAVVNGEKIFASDLEKYLASLPISIRDSAEKSRALNDLIVQTLIIQDARNRGFEENETMFLEVYNAILNQSNMSEDAFRRMIEREGIDYDSYIRNLKLMVYLNNYIYSYLINFVEVSEQEVMDFYQEMKMFFDNVSFEEAKRDIEAYIRQIKMQEFLVDYLKQLRSNANIEVYSYKTEICLLALNKDANLFLYGSEQCEPCREYKEILQKMNLDFEMFSEREIVECFDTALKQVRYIMPVLLCKDGSFILSKNESEIKEFAEKCK